MRDVTPSPEQILSDLRELIEALDRRVPHLERVGETKIAGDAAQLKRDAEERIAILTAEIARVGARGR